MFGKANIRMHLAVAAAITGILVYVYYIHREIKKLEASMHNVHASVASLQRQLIQISLPQHDDDDDDNIVGDADVDNHGTTANQAINNQAIKYPTNESSTTIETSMTNEKPVVASPAGAIDDGDTNSSVSSEEIRLMMQTIDDDNDDNDDNDDEDEEDEECNGAYVHIDADVCHTGSESGLIDDGVRVDDDHTNTNVDGHNAAKMMGNAHSLFKEAAITNDDIEYDHVASGGDSGTGNDAGNDGVISIDDDNDDDDGDDNINTDDHGRHDASPPPLVEQAPPPNQEKQSTNNNYAEYKLRALKVDDLKHILRTEFKVDVVKGPKESLVKAILDAQRKLEELEEELKAAQPVATSFT
jgi:hypothetical protein